MKQRHRVGIITIGQSPRDDVIPDLEALLGPNVQFLQEGALDGLADEAIRALEPRIGEAVLATRLLTGREVRLGHQSITPLLANAMQRACADGAELAVILCTGTFERARIGATIPVITADEALIHTATALAGSRNLLIVCPDTRQVPDMETRWSPAAPEALVVAASPYGDRGEFKSALKSVSAEVDFQPDRWLAVLDCVGYDLRHQQTVRGSLNLSAIIPRVAIAHLLQQLA